MSTKPAGKVEMSKARGAEYGNFRNMAALAQNLESVLVTEKMSFVQREAMGMICTKLARLAVGNPNSRDGWADIAGYADLVVVDLDRDDPEVYTIGTGPKTAR